MFEIPGGVRVIWKRPRPDLVAASNGVDRIWICPSLNQVEMRCALAHEVLHLENRHVGCQPPAVEQAVRDEVARRLIPIDLLCTAAAWTRSRVELCEELHITDLVLLDRLRTLTDAELAQLREATAHDHA
ncbi:ImmA/IrrE family metallo-endopeptidase [Paeniglutamicibacter sp. R2-26]|uniref:ImmA/IrrE family metallo-endopeptidase n=1 Tax=Paeniglutamicibacter sp. R2-26 TaxID=3144417 RepID=UPI003EE7797B